MQIEIDNRNPNIVYTGYQFGNYFRLNRNTGDQKYIQPTHELGENPYRFNWQTPIQLSSHNQDILYLGGNKLMRSMNKGDDWKAISGDLTNGGKKGNVAYGTITTISESPFQFGLMYTGSDDGQVFVTKNGGGNWSNIAGNLPKDLWVSRVIASSHKKERVYLTLNGYRWDDFTPYVFVSENYGATWKNIGQDIPLSAVNVIKEDPKNENVLYIGTDNGAYASLNRGKTWEVFSNGLPNVAIHDLVIQPTAKDLVLGTHGRSIYKTNVAPLQSASDELLKKELSGTYTIQIITPDGGILQEFSTKAEKGFNYAAYDLTLTEKGKHILEKEFEDEGVSKRKDGKYYLPIGKYYVKIFNKKTSDKISFEIK